MMLSVYRKVAAALIALACRDVMAINIQDENAAEADNGLKSGTVLKSDVSEYQKMVKVDTNDKVFFYWNVDDKFLDVRVVYKGLAWLGFGASPDGKLSDAEAIIGKPDSKRHHKVCKYNFYGEKKWTQAEKMEKEFQTLEAADIVQDDSTTTMTFKKKLEEDSEVAISKDGENKFFLVVGKKNHFHQPHHSYALKLNLSAEVVDSDAKKDTKKDETVEKDEEKSKSKTSVKGIHVHKQANIMFIVVGSCVGVLALLMLMLGTVAMRRQAEREVDFYEEPLIRDLNEENELA